MLELLDGYSNVKYLTEKERQKYNFNQSSEENKTEDVKHDNGVSNNKKVYTEDEDKGYPLISVRVFNDENGNKDEETQKLVSQYMMNWQEKTEEYNGRMGVTARIPDFFQEINNSCPKWSEKEIENICNYIEKYKVIPSLNYAPEEFNSYTKQVWWLAPFVLWNSNNGEVTSWLFIDKNGFYAAHPSDNDGALIFTWDIITDIDIDWLRG